MAHKLMEIVLLHYAASPIVGGVENVMRQHSRLLAEAGHRVRIVAGRGKQVDRGVDFRALPMVDSQSAAVRNLQSQLNTGVVPQDFERWSNEIEAGLRGAVGHADLLIAHNVCSLNKNLALTAALRRIHDQRVAPRLVLWHHDLAWLSPRYADELHAGMPWDLLRTDWPKAAQVTVSETRRQELMQLLGVEHARIRVVPNGIDVPAFLNLGLRTRDLIQTFRILDFSPLLLMPVRVTPRKKIELALRTLAILSAEWPRAGLLITGPTGPHSRENEAYVQTLMTLRSQLDLDGRAVFLTLESGTSLNDDVIADLYRIADAVLLTSSDEGFGIPLLEAGLARVPVFCSDIPTLREIGRDDVTYFSPESGPELVAEVLERGIPRTPAFAFRKRVLEDYAWHCIYENHIAPLLVESR